MAKAPKPVVWGGPVVFSSCPSDDLALQDAKDWIAGHGFTQDDVKILVRDGVLGVVAKRRLW